MDDFEDLPFEISFAQKSYIGKILMFLSASLQRPTSRAKRQGESRCHLAKNIEKGSRLMLPFYFVAFNLGYWSLHLGQYFK